MDEKDESTSISGTGHYIENPLKLTVVCLKKKRRIRNNQTTVSGGILKRGSAVEEIRRKQEARGRNKVDVGLPSRPHLSHLAPCTVTTSFNLTTSSWDDISSSLIIRFLLLDDLLTAQCTASF